MININSNLQNQILPVLGYLDKYINKKVRDDTYSTLLTNGIERINKAGKPEEVYENVAKVNKDISSSSLTPEDKIRVMTSLNSTINMKLNEVKIKEKKAKAEDGINTLLQTYGDIPVSQGDNIISLKKLSEQLSTTDPTIKYAMLVNALKSPVKTIYSADDKLATKEYVNPTTGEVINTEQGKIHRDNNRMWGDYNDNNKPEDNEYLTGLQQRQYNVSYKYNHPVSKPTSKFLNIYLNDSNGISAKPLQGTMTYLLKNGKPEIKFYDIDGDPIDSDMINLQKTFGQTTNKNINKVILDRVKTQYKNTFGDSVSRAALYSSIQTTLEDVNSSLLEDLTKDSVIKSIFKKSIGDINDKATISNNLYPIKTIYQKIEKAYQLETDATKRAKYESILEQLTPVLQYSNLGLTQIDNINNNQASTMLSAHTKKSAITNNYKTLEETMTNIILGSPSK